MIPRPGLFALLFLAATRAARPASPMNVLFLSFDDLRAEVDALRQCARAGEGRQLGGAQLNSRPGN